MIYFIQSDCPTGFIKIGYTRNLGPRLERLQCGSPYQLNVVRVISGTEQDEKALHERFASDKQLGEWFRPSDRLLDFIIGLTSQCLGGYPRAECDPDSDERRLRAARVARIRAEHRITGLSGGGRDRV